MVEERVQKFLASLGLGSRREIERWIQEGRLYVNGEQAQLGQRVKGDEQFTLDRRKLYIHKKQHAIQVLMYHKPVGEICSRKDPQGRTSVFSRLPKLKEQRWISIGRLDLNTQGLILFTNDGELAHRCTHPSAGLERQYWVRVLGQVDQEKIKKLTQGVMLEDGLARFTYIKANRNLNPEEDTANQYFTVTLTEGRNREVRRLWEAVDCKVSRLKRIAFGPIVLPRDLRAGEYRLLTDKQVNQLKKSISDGADRHDG